MSSKTNKILGAVLVIQVIVLVSSRLISDGTQGPIKPVKLLAGVDVDDITGLKITDDSAKTVELAKKAGKWVLASGGDYPVTEKKVTELLGKLPGLTARQAVTDKPSHHHKLEVAKDKFQRKLSLTLKEGKTRTFFLGTSPGLRKAHLRMEGKPEVYAPSGLSTWDFATTASNWVETEYFKVERDRIVTMTLTNANGQIDVSKGADGQWQVAGLKPTDKIKQSAIDSMLSSASSVALQAPIGKQIQPSHKLDQPQATLVVVAEVKEKAADGKDKRDAADDGQAKPDGATAEPDKTAGQAMARTTHTLKIGAASGDDGYFAKSDGSDFVVRVAKWAARSLLEKKRDELIDKEEKKEKVGDNGKAPGSSKERSQVSPG